jgi:hypothetical protein
MRKEDLMRTALITALLALVLVTMGPLVAPVASLLLAQQPDAPDVQVDVDMDGGAAWYANPLWIGIGILALVILVLLVVTATRGGGTTVIKD